MAIANSGTPNQYTIPTVSGVNTYLKKCATGQSVTDLQNALMALGYDVGKTGADSRFGANTANALKQFQRAQGIDVDAIYGQQSMGALQTALNALQGGSNVPATTSDTTTAPQIPTTDTTGGVSGEVLGQPTPTAFQYDVTQDPSYQAFVTAQTRNIMNEMNRRGLLGSSIEQERLMQIASEYAPQFEQAAYDRWLQGENLRMQQEESEYNRVQMEVQTEIKAEQLSYDRAMDKLQLTGYADNETARTLGIPAGTYAGEAETQSIESTYTPSYKAWLKSATSQYNANPKATIRNIMDAYTSGQFGDPTAPTTLELVQTLINSIEVQVTDMQRLSGDVMLPMQLWEQMIMNQGTGTEPGGVPRTARTSGLRSTVPMYDR